MPENFNTIHKRLQEYINMLISEKGYMYAGYPRYMELFGRDSIISAVELFYIHPEMLKRTLITLAEYQGKSYNNNTGEEPGKILHEVASHETFRYDPGKEKWVKPGIPLYYSIDSTPLFVIACELYMKSTQDDEFLHYIKGNLEKAVSWMVKKSEKTGFLTYNTAESGNRLAAQGWMDGAWSTYRSRSGDAALIEVQGYFYQAMKAYNELFPGNQLRSIIDSRLDFLENYLDTYFWMDDEQYYSPAVFFKGIEAEKVNMVSSVAGHLIFTKIVNKNRKASIVRRLFEDDMATPFGIRTLSSENCNFDPYKYQSGSIWPHDNWLILNGLKYSGFNKEVALLKSYILNAIQAIKEPYEYYSVDRSGNIINMEDLEIPPCMPQAWSVGAFASIIDGKF